MAQGLQLGGLLGLLLQGAVLLFQRDHPAAQLVHLAGDFLQGVVAPLQVLHAGPGLVPDFRLYLQLVHPLLKLLALLAVFPGVVAVVEGHGEGGGLPGDIGGGNLDFLQHLAYLVRQGLHIFVALLGDEAANHAVDFQPHPPFFHNANPSFPTAFLSAV